MKILRKKVNIIRYQASLSLDPSKKNETEQSVLALTKQESHIYSARLKQNGTRRCYLREDKTNETEPNVLALTR